MNVIRNPKTVATPVGPYSHSVEVPAGTRTLYVAGQVGMKLDGTMAEGIEEQCEWAWKNLTAVLDDAGMGIEDVVKIHVYLTDPAHAAAYRKVRDPLLGSHRPTAMLTVISQFGSRDTLIEIEAIAAKA